MISLILTSLVCILILCPDSTKTVSPCESNAEYMKETGKCYRILSILKSFTDMNNTCTSPYSLTVLKDKNELQILEKLLNKIGNNENIWLYGHFQMSTNLLWWYGNHGNVNKSIFDYEDLSINETCIVLKITYEQIQYDSTNMEYKIRSKIKSVRCSDENSAVCELSAQKCKESTIEEFSTASMELYPRVSYIGNVVKIRCREGYYSKDDVELDVQCLLQLANDEPRWKKLNSLLMSCEKIECDKPDFDIPNAVKEFNQSKERYQYGDEISFKCNHGYINYMQGNKKTASIICKQLKKKGIWEPESMEICVPIKCNLTELENLKPKDAEIIKVRNRVTKREYNVNFQKSQFANFDNILEIKCTDQLFFSDRKITKSFICDLKNQSEIESMWNGYGGTLLTVKLKCIAVTCMYEDVNEDKCENLEKVFQLSNSQNQLLNISSHDGMHYNYTNKLKFYCTNKHTTGNQEKFQIINCGASGVWIPKLTSCIRQSEKVNTGMKKHYIPPPKNADKAQEIGVTVIIILVIFLSIVIILDLSRITKDVKILKKNITVFKQYIRPKKEIDVENYQKIK